MVAPEGGKGRPLPGRGLRRPTGRTAWGEAAETRTGAGAGSKETPGAGEGIFLPSGGGSLRLEGKGGMMGGETGL